MTELQHNGDLSGVETRLELLARHRTDWQLVEIVHHPVYGNQLLIDHDLQISESDVAYNTAMTAPVLTLDSLSRVAILGGGDGGVLHELLQCSTRLDKGLEQATLVDIDGEVIRLCRQYMPRLCQGAFDDARAEIVVGDAFAWLENARQLDAVIYDLTMEPVREGIGRNEFIQEILDKVSAALRAGGIISLQACGDWQEDRDELLAQLREHLDARFANRLEQTVMIPSYGEMWTFMAARKPA